MESLLFDEVVATFYEAAGGLVTWRTALEQFAVAATAHGVYMLAMDPRDQRLKFAHAAGSMPVQAMVDYLDYWHAHNPRVPRTLALGPDEWMHCHEHYDEDYVRRSAFYQEFLIPYNARYTSTARVLQEPGLVVSLLIVRTAQTGPVRRDELDQIERLRAHLRRAYAMYHVAHSRTRAWDIGRQLVEELPQPTWVVSHDRQVLYRNRAAEAKVARGDLLTEVAGRLRCVDPANDGRLSEVLGLLAVDLDMALEPLTLPRPRAVRLVGSGSGLPTPLFASILPPGASGEVARAEVSRGAPAIRLTVHDRDELTTPDASAVGSVFDLTPAESRIAVSLARGLTVEQIATGHSVAVATVRSQVKSVFQKTGARRQADVVRLLSQLPDLAALAPRPAPAPRPR